MAKYEMTYKEMARRIAAFVMTNLNDNKDGYAFQKFVEAMALPVGTDVYNEVILEEAIYTSLVNKDIFNQKLKEQGKLVIDVKPEEHKNE